jgi:replication initiation and membrane attachment protein DnaB
MSKDDLDFMTKARFSKMVESTVINKQLSYMDAIIHLCEQYQIEIEDCKKYVSPVIKQKLEVEAMRLNFFPQGNELPI